MDNKQQPTLLDNWIGWLQARMPSLKESHNVYWLKQAMEGYKSYRITMDKDKQQLALDEASDYAKNIQKFHNELQNIGDNVKPLLPQTIKIKNIYKKIFIDNPFVPNPEAPDKVPSAEEYIRRLYPLSDKFSRLGCEKIAESYALLREQRAVGQDKEEENNKVLKLAVNAIYFSDSADYLRALYQIVNELKKTKEGEKANIDELFDKLNS